MANTQHETPQEQYERALFRAKEAGVEVVARGRRKSDQARIFCTTSTSSPNQWRIVVVAGDRLECTCPARRMCVHRAVARAELLREATERRVRVEETKLAFLLGVAEGRVSGAASADVASERETAILLHPSGNKPASQWMWK